MGGHSIATGRMCAPSWKMFKKVLILLLCLLGSDVAFSQDCGGELIASDTEQEIAWSGGDGQIACQWSVLTTELSTYIRLTVAGLSLPETPNCESHRIEIWHNGFIIDDENPTKLCGNGVGSWTYFLSTGQRMLVRFVSEGAVAGETRQFLLTYIKEVDLEPKMLFTEKVHGGGNARVNTLPANVLEYLNSETIRTRFYYQVSDADWKAVVSDRHERTIFWSDGTNNRIIRGSIGHHSAGKGVFEGVSNEVQGLTIDWIAKNVYMTDALYNWILVMNYDASMILHVATTGLDVPRGIAVHPMRSYLFWTDCGNHPRIERSDLAGGDRRVIVDTGLTSPNGIAVDFQTHRIYWTNVGTLANTVESSLLDGGDRQTLFSMASLGAELFHIISYQDYLYVTDRQGYIRCLSKSSLGSEETTLTLGSTPYGVAVYDAESQPMFESPCSSNPCSHMCVGSAVEPRYKCLCPRGRPLLTDGRTCGEVTRISHPALFVAGTNRLCKLPSNYPTMTIKSDFTLDCFLSGRQHAVALAADVKDQMLFFSDISAKTVAAVSLIQHSKSFEITGLTQSVEGMAVDWISNNVYWTDNPAGKISVSTYDGQFQKDLITTDVVRPRPIAIEPFAKYLFWGEFGGPAQIERADLDGSNRRVIVSEELITPNGFTIDYSEQRLYFADATTGAIQIVGYNGQDRVTFLQRPSSRGHNFFGMTLYQDFIIWTEFARNNGLYVANRNTGEMIREHLITEEVVFGLTMYAEYNQPEEEGPCSVDNGGCNQLCLPTSSVPEGRVCHCSVGFRLDDDDGRTCVSRVVLDNFVLFPDTYLNKVFQVDLTDPNHTLNGLPLGTMRNPIAVSYDPQDRMVYWSDVKEHCIYRAGLDGSHRQRIVAENIQVPDGLTIDPVGRLLFWTDQGNRSISVATLTGQQRVTLISDGLENPRAIALHTSMGYMYWTDWGAEAKIERSFMDGSVRVTIANTDLGWPNGLTVDTTGNKLYWADARTDKIEITDLDGQNRRVLIDFSSNVHPYGIGIYGGHVYWTDWSQYSLMRADKADGENVESLTEAEGLKRPNELHIYSSNVPAQGHASCISDNGGCSGLCLPSFHGRTCHCGDQESLDVDGVSCTLTEDHITTASSCPFGFDQGELDDDCTGQVGVECAVSCWTGFTNRVWSVTCLHTGEWNEDLSTVCEEIYIPPVEETEELTVDIFLTTEEEELALGEPLRVTCETNDDESISLAWYKDGNLLDRSNREDDFFMFNNHLVIPSFEVLHQGRYSCSVYREQDGAMADGIVEVYLPLEVLFSTVPENATIEEFDNYVLGCSPQDRRHSITWERNGLPLVMNEHVNGHILSDALLFRDVRLQDAGIYTCVLKRGSLRIASVSATVRVDALVRVEEVCGTITAEEALHAEPSFARIVGGRKAIRGSAPWMVRLYHRDRRQHFCGGSLLNNYWVVAAAHCIRESGVGVNDLMIRIGEYDTRQTDDSEILKSVEAIHLPDGYDFTTYDQDIALIKLEMPVLEFNDYIRPICLPNATIARRMFRIGNKGKVTGWGQIAESGTYPRYMTEVTLPLVGRRRCRASTEHLVTMNMFCAGYPRESGDACRGDSGGPFSMEYQGRWHIFGIVSWGEGCGVDGKYGFYTRVSKFLDWINGHINS